MLEAAVKAADATAYSDQLTLSGLEAWRVKKVFAVQDGDKQGTVNITPSQWAPRTGRSLAESAEQGRSLLRKEIQMSRGTLASRSSSIICRSRLGGGMCFAASHCSPAARRDENCAILPAAICRRCSKRLKNGTT